MDSLGDAFLDEALEAKSNNLGATIGGVVGFILFFIIILFITHYYCCKEKKTVPMTPGEFPAPTTTMQTMEPISQSQSGAINA